MSSKKIKLEPYQNKELAFTIWRPINCFAVCFYHPHSVTPASYALIGQDVIFTSV